MQLQHALDQFADSHRRQQHSERTIEFYSAWLHSLDRFLILKDLEAITLADLRAWVDSLIKSNYAPNSWRGAALTAKIFFKWCTLEKLIDQNVADRLELPKATKRIPDAIDTSDVLTLINDLNRSSHHPDRDCAIICFMAQTGARLSEVANLTIGQLHISEGYAVVIGKGDKQRWVFFGDATRQALTKLLAEQTSQQASVFGLTAHGIQQVLKRLNRRTGVKCNAHKIRRTSATLRAENGAQGPDLRLQMGWEQIETADHYIVQARLRQRAASSTPIDSELLHAIKPK